MSKGIILLSITLVSHCLELSLQDSLETELSSVCMRNYPLMYEKSSKKLQELQQLLKVLKELYELKTSSQTTQKPRHPIDSSLKNKYERSN